MQPIKHIVLSTLLASVSLPAAAQSAAGLAYVGQPSFFSNFLTAAIILIFAGILIAAIRKLYKENGIEKDDPYAKRIGCTGIFLIALVFVLVLSATANSYTGIHIEEHSKNFLEWVIVILRKIF